MLLDEFTQFILAIQVIYQCLALARLVDDVASNLHDVLQELREVVFGEVYP